MGALTRRVLPYLLVLAFVAPARADEAPAAVSGEDAARRCFDAAQADYFAGRLAEARRGFECAYAKLPSAELAWNLARVCERMGDVDAGVHYFRDYLARANVNQRERKRVEARIRALEDLAARQAAALKPGPDTAAALSDEARKFFDRGAKLYRTGHYAAAAAAFGAALQLSDAPELHYNLAMTAERLQKPQEACDHYRAYLAAAPAAADGAEVRAKIEKLEATL
jgi:tetratricopeptide (TPR) repeat protein